jgi:hypothetical protein
MEFLLTESQEISTRIKHTKSENLYVHSVTNTETQRSKLTRQDGIAPGIGYKQQIILSQMDT